MDEKQINKILIEESKGLIDKVSELSEGGAKVALFCAYITMRLADENGTIIKLYERVTDCYLKAQNKARAG